MADIIEMDELEAFILDFLAYRREQRLTRTSPPRPAPKALEYKPEQNLHSWESAPAHAEPPPPGEAAPMPHSIGKGWPHYRDAAKIRYPGQFTNPEPPHSPATQVPHVALSPSHTSAAHNDIIPALAPIVAQALSRFGPPTNPKAMGHLVNHVIAGAMNIPLVSESIQTAEIKPWGRVALLQAVIELLIRISTQ